MKNYIAFVLSSFDSSVIDHNIFINITSDEEILSFIDDYFYDEGYTEIYTEVFQIPGQDNPNEFIEKICKVNNFTLENNIHGNEILYNHVSKQLKKISRK